MSLPLNFTLLPLAKQVSLKDVFGADQDTLIVWLYTHISKNHKADSQPNILVAFRKVDKNGNLSDQIVYKRAPITALGQLRIGSVWQNGLCCFQAVFEEAKFDVNFSADGWTFTSFEQVADSPYPWASYPLDYSKDKNQFLKFDMNDGRKLIVPCVEFFYRCYGRSAEIKRVLTTFPWHGETEAHLSKLYAPLGEPEENSRWKVKLKKRLVLDDVLLLAHAKYEDSTEQILKKIYSQIEAKHEARNAPKIFLQIQPWHQGAAQLKVKGLRLPDDSFLALQIVGCSDPEGIVVQRDKEDQYGRNGFGIETQGGDNHGGCQVRRFNKGPDIIDLTGDFEPDHGFGSTEIIDSDFEVLGKPRAVIDVRRDRPKTVGAQNSISGGEASPSVVSGGDPYGSGKGVGQASVLANQVLESHGMLRDMWNAMLYLQSQDPMAIKPVEWFTVGTGFSTAPEFQLLALTPFKVDEVVPSKIRNWFYFDVDNQVPRGVLVVRLQVSLKTVYIVEVQRRSSRKKKDNKNLEESFKGLVFILDQDQSLEEWLIELLSEIRNEVGIVKKVVEKCPGIADTFLHLASGNGEIACQAAVVNALEKVGIVVENIGPCRVLISDDFPALPI